MYTVLLPPSVNPIAVDKYIISYHIISNGANYLPLDHLGLLVPENEGTTTLQNVGIHLSVGRA